MQDHNPKKTWRTEEAKTAVAAVMKEVGPLISVAARIIGPKLQRLVSGPSFEEELVERYKSLRSMGFSEERSRELVRERIEAVLARK